MMTTREKGGCRLLLEQLVGTGTVVTTDGRTYYDVVETDLRSKVPWSLLDVDHLEVPSGD